LRVCANNARLALKFSLRRKLRKALRGDAEFEARVHELSPDALPEIALQ
jgi:hypothetical protein